jgi:hypothetical protein
VYTTTALARMMNPKSATLFLVGALLSASSNAFTPTSFVANRASSLRSAPTKMVAGGASAYGEEYYDGTLKCAQLVVAPRMPHCAARLRYAHLLLLARH